MARDEYAWPRFATPSAAATARAQVRTLLTGVRRWIGAGLAITAIAVWSVANSPRLAASIAANRPIVWVLVAQLGIVFVLPARVEKLGPATASRLLIAYSALSGVTLSFILLVHTGDSVASTFFVAGMIVAALALHGTRTRRVANGPSAEALVAAACPRPTHRKLFEMIQREARDDRSIR